jgi:hypothetical protein
MMSLGGFGLTQGPSAVVHSIATYISRLEHPYPPYLFFLVCFPLLLYINQIYNNFISIFCNKRNQIVAGLHSNVAII